MSRFADSDDAGGGEGAGREPLSGPFFDPLLTPWEEAPAAEAITLPDFEDPLFALAAGPGFELAEPAPEALAWETPPASTYSAQGAAAPAYPDRFQPSYQERLTEFQRRLRAETITIPRPRRRWAVTVRELTETLLLAVLIFMAVRASFQNFKVEGQSMEPSLEDGEYLIVNKLSYTTLDLGIFDWLPFYDAGDQSVRHLWSSPSRGDVVVFRAPTSPSRDFIKRIIGVPGDTVEIDEATGTVKVNGAALQEGYIQGSTHCSTADCRWEIPGASTPEALARCGSDACYFVMGDNRQNSSDSRQGWLVPEENIIGKALITYWHQGGPELDLAPNHSVGLADKAAAED